MAKPTKARQVKADTYQYCYNLNDLKDWYERGKSHGDTGSLLIRSHGPFDTYLCFGTIENPSTTITILTMTINPLFDNLSPIAGVRAIQRTMHSAIKKRAKSSAKMIFLDTNNLNTSK